MDNPFVSIKQRLKNIEILFQRIYSDKLQGIDTTGNYYKINRAAEFLSSTPNSLRVMVNKNQISYIKKQGQLFFRQSDLIEWLEDEGHKRRIDYIGNMPFTKWAKQIILLSIAKRENAIIVLCYF